MSARTARSHLAAARMGGGRMSAMRGGRCLATNARRMGLNACLVALIPGFWPSKRRCRPINHCLAASKPRFMAHTSGLVASISNYFASYSYLVASTGYCVASTGYCVASPNYCVASPHYCMAYPSYYFRSNFRFLGPEDQPIRRGTRWPTRGSFPAGRGSRPADAGDAFLLPGIGFVREETRFRTGAGVAIPAQIVFCSISARPIP